MAIYKFRVSLEQDNEVYRDIEVKSNQSFASFLEGILKSMGFTTGAEFSFFQSDSQWHKEDWITGNENLKGPVKVSQFIFDPHQRFILEYDLSNPWEFYIELIKLTPKETLGVVYPVVVKKEGIAPAQFKPKPIISDMDEEEDDNMDDLNDSDDGDDDGNDFQIDMEEDLDDLTMGDEDSADDYKIN
ncbi:MAG: hypothetical protein ACJATA_001908 [Sphingobacteriales bacterium]|jgi:hypothetical protein